VSSIGAVGLADGSEHLVLQNCLPVPLSSPLLVVNAESFLRCPVLAQGFDFGLLVEVENFHSYSPRQLTWLPSVADGK
jgi:hypothetical protein